ncbi:hypothetical protein D5086_009672 [Populus alba]|uniref:Uncharacterized protein n=1 Tax=Populus alba TaxID=43335 RepID=A0ACC4C777_POPAL
MAEIKIIVICQLGGDFETDKDGTLSYTGGDAHAIDIDDKIKFNDFKLEVAEISSRTTLSEEEPPIDAPLAVLEDITQPDNSLSAPLDLDVVDDTNNADVLIEDPQIDPLEISPILPLLASNDEKHAKGAQQWQNTITGVGQRFRSVHEFRESLRKYAIAHQFACRARLATRPEIFQRCIESIKSISLEAYKWILQSEPQNWAKSSREEKLEKENLKVHSLQVLLSAGSTFEVRGESVEVVDIDRWDCSCKEWQVTGFPCCHALAVIGCIGRCPYDYCSRYFTTESYRLTYSESVHPVTNVDMPVEKDSSQVVAIVTPPPTRRPPGRPCTKKYGQKDVVKQKCYGYKMDDTVQLYNGNALESYFPATDRTWA